MPLGANEAEPLVEHAACEATGEERKGRARTPVGRPTTLAQRGWTPWSREGRSSRRALVSPRWNPDSHRYMYVTCGIPTFSRRAVRWRVWAREGRRVARRGATPAAASRCSSTLHPQGEGESGPAAAPCRCVSACTVSCMHRRLGGRRGGRSGPSAVGLARDGLCCGRLRGAHRISQCTPPWR